MADVENKAISDLTAATEVTGSELLVMEQDGTAKSVTPDVLKTYMGGGTVKTVNGTSPDENGNIELELTGEPAITSADAVLSGTTLTITVGKADGTTSVIVGTLTEDNLLTNLSVDGTDIPVTMEGF